MLGLSGNGRTHQAQRQWGRGAVISCDRCAALERELIRMGRDLERARRRIERLERVLKRIVRLCLKVQGRAEPILSRKSGVPRGFWSRIKGRVDVAELILRQLG